MLLNCASPRQTSPIRSAAKSLLCSLLTLGILAQPIVGAYSPQALAAEPIPSSAPGRSASNQPSKVALLLVLAVREENPVKALELLTAAREELKRENLSKENAGRVLAAIDAIEAKIRRRLPSAPSATPQPSSLLVNTLPTVAGLNNSPSNAAANEALINSAITTVIPEREIQELISSHPEIREALWEIGQGRLSRDAENLDGIIKEKTGKSLDELDAEEALAIATGNKPGPFYQLLERLNMLNLDVAKANLKLKQEFDGVSIDVLADKIIMDATKYSIPAGVLQGVLADSGMGGRFLGISSEVLMTFVINANLALRLSDLYDIQMNNSEKEIVLLVVFLSLIHI